jgi:ankyrin repeat protein
MLQIIVRLPKNLKHRAWVAISCYLVKNGADVGWSNSDGHTPFDYLISNQDVAELIVKHADKLVSLTLSASGALLTY